MDTALLLAALVVPVALFWLLKSRARLGNTTSALVAIVAGWAFNLAWAFAAHESTTIAAAFGWLCPAVLVLLTWLVWRFTRRRVA